MYASTQSESHELIRMFSAEPNDAATRGAVGELPQSAAEDVDTEIDVRNCRLLKPVSFVKTASEEHLQSRILEILVKDPAARRRFVEDGVTFTPLLSAFRAISPQQRLEVLKDTIERFLASNREERAFFRGPFHLFVRELTPPQRAMLTEPCLNKKPDPTKTFICQRILIASWNVLELEEVICEIGNEKLPAFQSGVDRLLALPGTLVREIVVHAVLQRELRKLKIPAPIERHPGEEEIEAHSAEVRKKFNKIKTICSQLDKRLQDTEAVRNYRQIAAYNSKMLDGLETVWTDLRERRDALNRIIEKAEIEIRHKKLFQHAGEDPSIPEDEWTSQEMREVDYNLGLLPESKVLFTPLFFVLTHDSTHLSSEEWAARLSEYKGNIAIHREVFVEGHGDRKPDGLGSPRSRIMHEFGHAIFYGNSTQKDKGGRIIDSYDGMIVDPIYCMDRFMTISDWRVFSDGITIKDKTVHEYSVSFHDIPEAHQYERTWKFGGREYWITLEKEDVRYPDGFIYTHQLVEFVPGEARHDTPHEDMCCHFEEYEFAAGKLIDHAVLKFMYYEEHFGLYKGDKKTLDYCAEKYFEKYGLKDDMSDVAIVDKENEGLTPWSRALLHAFSSLDSVDQSEVVSATLAMDPRDPSVTLNLRRRMPPSERRNAIREKLREVPEAEQVLSEALYQVMKAYRPGILLMRLHQAKGEQVGVLSDRGNRTAHERVIQELQHIVGGSIPKRNIYFLADETKSKRLTERHMLDRRFHVLADFARGYYFDHLGELKRMSGCPQEICYVDSRDNELLYIQERAKACGLQECLKVYDVRDTSHTELWRQLRDISGAPPAIRSPQHGRMTFFDLDATLAKLDGMFRLMDPAGETELLAISPEEYSKHPEIRYWAGRLKNGQSNNGHDFRSLSFNFDDHHDQARIAQILEDGLDGLRAFKEPINAGN